MLLHIYLFTLEQLTNIYENANTFGSNGSGPNES